MQQRCVVTLSTLLHHILPTTYCDRRLLSIKVLIADSVSSSSLCILNAFSKRCLISSCACAGSLVSISAHVMRLICCSICCAYSFQSSLSFLSCACAVATPEWCTSASIVSHTCSFSRCFLSSSKIFLLSHFFTACLSSFASPSSSSLCIACVGASSCCSAASECCCCWCSFSRGVDLPSAMPSPASGEGAASV